MTSNFSFALNQELHLLNHPFYQAWNAGHLTTSTLQDYACQYYHHVEAFPRYLKNALNYAETTDQRDILAENLAEEDGTAYGTPHPELWMNFAEGLGVSRVEVNSSTPRKAIQAVVDNFTQFSKSSLAEALGSLYAYEAQVPEVAQSKMDGLKKFYGISDDRSLSFFAVHKEADVLHRESIKGLIDALPVEDQKRAQVAADASSSVLWNFLTEISEVHGVACA